MWNWLTIENARAFAVPVAIIIASIVAARVAKAQKDIAYDKLKFDLLDKRYAVFVAAKDLIECIAQGKAERVQNLILEGKEVSAEDVAFLRKHYVCGHSKDFSKCTRV
jgi:hypothetical protein